MNERYQETTAVIFDDEIVPFWKCKYYNDEMYGDTFLYNDITSTHTQPALWDCKKEKFISFFVIEHAEDNLFKVGDKVVYTQSPNKNEALMTEVEAIVEDTCENYYSKYNEEKDSVRVQGYTIPEHIKVIIHKYKKYMYKLKGVEIEVHPLYIFKIKE